MTLKRPNLFLWLTLAAAWEFDFLFWEKPFGISFPIFVGILLAAGLFLAKQEERAPAWRSLLLLIPVAFFSFMTAVRLEPFTSFMNIAATIILLAVFSHTFLGGQWWRYEFRDYFLGGLSLITDAPVLQTLTFTNQNRQEDAPKLKGVKGAVFWGVLRGLLIALPVVAFFAILLTSADAVFALRFEDFLNFLKIEDIAEYILRGFIILLVSYLLAGVYIHAFYKNHDESLDDERKPWFPAMLGIVESAIVLGSTNLLFISFVVIQFQYFFGGSANIYLDGYTYSEYARRGFGELIAVAVFSLLLFVTLSQITKRETGRQKGVFSALGIVLVSLVLVILVSSFQRLQLYELAYGFSRLRAYSHVFIIWLGILLLAVILLEIRQRQKFLVLVVSIAAIGFVVSLNLLNVDSFIAKQNIARIAKGKGLDIGYLSRLSPDVLPTLWQSYQEKPSSMVAGAIACYAEWYDMDPEEELPWQSFHFSRRNAAAAWAEIEDFPAAKVFQAKFDGKKENWWNAYVVINSRHQHCSNGNRD